jgi:hypothetical protein
VSRSQIIRLVCALSSPCVFAAAVACGSDSTSPSGASGTLELTPGVLRSLDSAGQAIEQANPTDPDLKALVDSTLLALNAGLVAKRLDVSTDLTASPLYFVAIHRTFVGQTNAFSTWNLVGFDDPTHLTTLVEVDGFAPGTTSAPSAVTGTIGDGSGIVNGLLLRVGAGGSVTKWIANTGAASFVSDPAGAPCPGFTATSVVSCALETVHVHFTVHAASGSGGAGPSQASVTTDVDAPGMRLKFTP